MPSKDSTGSGRNQPLLTDLSDLLGAYSTSDKQLTSTDTQPTAEIIQFGKPSLSAMLYATNEGIVEAGASLHWLVAGEKRPIAADWAALPNQSLSDLHASYKAGCNIGIRLGEPSQVDGLYLHLIDLDVRDASKAAEAWKALLTIWPSAKDFPSVISGSGGESRHIYFLSDKPFRKTKLAKSEGFKMVFDALKGRDVKK